MKTILIAAIGTQNIIGKDNTMPWSLKDDLKFFKETTKDNIVLMGRKTFESVGSRTLPERINVVLTNSNPYCCIPKECEIKFTTNFDDIVLVDYIDSNKKNHIVYFTNNTNDIGNKLKKITFVPSNANLFIIGGSHLYNAFIDKADEFYRTNVIINNIDNINEYVLFPNFDESKWNKEYLFEVEKGERNSHNFSVERLTKIK